LRIEVVNGNFFYLLLYFQSLFSNKDGDDDDEDNEEDDGEDGEEGQEKEAKEPKEPIGMCQ
jgi:hypothetical protein